jgi:hypothetical protein
MDFLRILSNANEQEIKKHSTQLLHVMCNLMFVMHDESSTNGLESYAKNGKL